APSLQADGGNVDTRQDRSARGVAVVPGEHEAVDRDCADTLVASVEHQVVAVLGLRLGQGVGEEPGHQQPGPGPDGAPRGAPAARAWTGRRSGPSSSSWPAAEAS